MLRVIDRKCELLASTRSSSPESCYSMKTLLISDSIRYPRMTTQELRESFLIGGLSRPGEIHLTYVDLDRAVIGIAMPLDRPIALESNPELRAQFFTERRELGALNIGGEGMVHVGNSSYPLENLDLDLHRA